MTPPLNALGDEPNDLGYGFESGGYLGDGGGYGCRQSSSDSYGNGWGHGSGNFFGDGKRRHNESDHLD